MIWPFNKPKPVLEAPLGSFRIAESHAGFFVVERYAHHYRGGGFGAFSPRWEFASIPFSSLEAAQLWIEEEVRGPIIRTTYDPEGNYVSGEAPK